MKLIKKEQYGEGYGTHVHRFTFDDGRVFIGDGREWYSFPEGEKANSDMSFRLETYMVGHNIDWDSDGFSNFKRIISSSPCVKVEEMK